MITKPNFLSIMAIKQLVPRMLLVVGLACTVLVSIPNWSLADSPVVSEVVKDNNGNPIGIKVTTTHGSGGSKTEETTYTAGPQAGVHAIVNEDAKGNMITMLMTGPDGTRWEINKDASGSGVQTLTHPNGTVATTTFDPTGKPTGLTLKDSKGNVTTTVPDGKGGFTSAVTEKHGQVATTSYDANGKPTGETTKDKHGKVVSSTVYDSTGKVVSQTGKNKKFSDAGAQSTGGTQTAQGSGKHKDKHKFQTKAFQSDKHKDKHKFQTQVFSQNKDKHNSQDEFFHQNKKKEHAQDSGSFSGSSGSGQSHHHGRR